MTYRIAAIDIHKKVLMVVVAVAAAEVVDVAGEALEFICQRFGTGAEERRRLVRWLQQQEVTEVVMESTAQYWKPIWLELEPAFSEAPRISRTSITAPSPSTRATTPTSSRRGIREPPARGGHGAEREEGDRGGSKISFVGLALRVQASACANMPIDFTLNQWHLSSLARVLGSARSAWARSPWCLECTGRPSMTGLPWQRSSTRLIEA